MRNVLLCLIAVIYIVPVLAQNHIYTEKESRVCFNSLQLIIKSQDKLAQNIINVRDKLAKKKFSSDFKYAESVNLAHLYYRQFNLLQQKTLGGKCHVTNLKKSKHLRGKRYFQKGELEGHILDDLSWFVWLRGIAKINTIYYDSTQLRRIIQDKAKVGNLERFVVFTYQRKIFRKKTRKHFINRFYYAQILFNKIRAYLPRGSVLQEGFNSLLRSGMADVLSNTYLELNRKSYVSKIFKDRFYLLKKLTVDVFNSRFGNAAGDVILRKGRLYLNDQAISLVKKSLRPFDILFEKTPFILTDRTIPGHFGHVALYLGTKEELQNLGLWGHKSLDGFREKIERGYTVLEAARTGVGFKKLVDFMNVDELLILRASKSTDTHVKRESALEKSLAQYGRKYDFNFNVETVSEVVCSELIFYSFPEIPWKTESILGRETISPDDLVRRSIESQDLEMVLYIKGKRKKLKVLQKRHLVRALRN